MSVIKALLSELTDEDLDQLAELLRPRFERARAPQEAPAPDRWLNARDAAEYLGMTVTALHKHTAAKSIPFEQDGPRGKLWFKTSELDAWRRGDWQRLAA